MMRAIRRSVATTALAATAVLVPATPAGGAEAVVDIRVGESGFAAPAPRPAGPVTFRVTTTAPGQTTVGLLRLHDGVPLERVLGHIRLVFSEDPNVVVEAGRAMMRDADQLGTAVTEPGIAVTFTVSLPPGRYYLVDYHKIYDGAPGDWVRPFDVVPCRTAAAPAGPAAPAALAAPAVMPAALATLVLDEPRMYAPARMAVGAPFRVINVGEQPNEAVLMPVRPGATRAELQAFFTALDSGVEPPTFPIIGNSVGMGPISAGHGAVVTTGLPAGNYVLVTWFPDFRTTRMLAAQGMFAMVTLA